MGEKEGACIAYGGMYVGFGILDIGDELGMLDMCNCV